jgi:hypothetical protein
MTAPAEQRVRHRRRVTRRRAVIASVAALGLTGAAFATTSPLSTAGDGSQDEGQDPIFESADGAVPKNVIIGVPGADGVHCKHSCMLRNMWWLDVGEDAAGVKGRFVEGRVRGHRGRRGEGLGQGLPVQRRREVQRRRVAQHHSASTRTTATPPRGPCGTTCTYKSSDITYKFQTVTECHP